MPIVFKNSTHGMTLGTFKRTYGNGKWYIANTKQLAYSIDKGATWQMMSDLPVNTIYSICHGNGRLVLLGIDIYGYGVNAVLMDGSTAWQSQPIPTAYYNIKWCKDRFVATDHGGTAYATSTDGLTWTSVAFDKALGENTVNFVNGVVTIWGVSGGDGYISYNNGVSFTKITSAPPVGEIVYGNGYYFGVQYSDDKTQNTYRSTDLITWEAIETAWPGVHRYVAFVDGQFITHGPNNKLYLSSDAKNWVTHTMEHNTMHTVMDEGGVFMMFPNNVDAVLYYIYNSAPTSPGSISVPAIVNGGTGLTVEWSAASDTDNDLSGYVLERSANNGNWSEVYRGALRSYKDIITFGWTSVQYRVKAYDAHSAESSYVTSETRTVNNNTAPTISGSDGNLGTFSTSFTAQSYTVNDAQGGTVTVVERLDGVVKRTYNATLGTAASFSFAAAEWRQVLNGPHTITITATDSLGLSTVRTWTFTKAVNTLTLTITPLPADAMPDRCVVDAAGYFPTGSTLKIEVCNNANDASPRWEDVSDKLGKKHFFTNTSKTASAWAFGLRCTLTRGTATGAVWLDYITINYR